MRSSASIFSAVALAVCAACTQNVDFGSERLTRIAFGSCLRQDLPAPIWKAVVDAKPEIWVWLGDNIYGDTDDPIALADAYRKVKTNPGYERLRESTKIFGTWDDHDFGKNNGGKEWMGKAVNQTALLDFLEEPADSPRRDQEGVFASYDFGEGKDKVKLLLLDVRTFRDDPADPTGDIFGEKQRVWIEDELSDNGAALTLICSGTQVIPQDHRFERWDQFPAARQWFFDQLVEHGTGPVLFLSGDRHISEFSKIEIEGREQPFYEITSSGLTHSWTDFPGEPNRHRVGDVFNENSFGLIEIDWERRQAKVTMRDTAGDAQRELVIDL